jgi:hypothetical protein
MATKLGQESATVQQKKSTQVVNMQAKESSEKTTRK